MYTGSAKRQGCADCSESMQKDANIDILWMMFIPSLLILALILSYIAYFVGMESVLDGSCGSGGLLSDECYAI